MKKIGILLLFSLVFFRPVAKADEGMWLLMLLEQQNYQEMKKQGLRLSAKQIYDANQSSLKDAIVQFGRGCTGEIISEQGLLLTNHHCGYGQIQEHSTVEHDYLTNGFWAYNKSEELPNPGLTATFLVKMEDVTAKILNGITDDTSEEQRASIVAEKIKAVQAEAIQGTHYTSRVAPMFDGNQYVLFIYEVFKDVRLVGAPPSSIGKFGSDTDNWMWPRHTGDFALFRIYADANGKPAEYAKNNVPLKPKHALPVSIKGVKNDDFVMIMGFPGTTDRFLTSPGVQRAVDQYNPSVVTARTALRDVMSANMKAQDKVRIQYASKFARLSNYWKFYIGQTKCLTDLDVYGTKQELENRFAQWVKANPERSKQYGNVLSDIELAFAQTMPLTYLNVYSMEAILRGSSVFSVATQMQNIERKLRKNETPTQDEIQALKQRMETIFKDYDETTEKELCAAGMDIFFKNVPIEHQPKEFLKLAFEYKYNFTKLSEDLFEKSQLVNLDKVNQLLDAKKASLFSEDPIFALAQYFLSHYQEKNAEVKESYAKLGKANRLFVRGVMEMDKDKHFAPNANSTIRYTYGKVKNYKPQDGITYDPTTSLEGVVAKDDPSTAEFTVPAKLKELYAKKDYGRYSENGTVPVGFIANLDITGGNSGSPVINGKGELVGVAFDGNWEAMSGNIAFNPELQRCISVDIRYVLFIIEKYAGAKNLIDEMKIVR